MFQNEKCPGAIILYNLLMAFVRYTQMISGKYNTARFYFKVTSDEHTVQLDEKCWCFVTIIL